MKTLSALLLLTVGLILTGCDSGGETKPADAAKTATNAAPATK